METTAVILKLVLTGLVFNKTSHFSDLRHDADQRHHHRRVHRHAHLCDVHRHLKLQHRQQQQKHQRHLKVHHQEQRHVQIPLRERPRQIFAHPWLMFQALAHL